MSDITGVITREEYEELLREKNLVITNEDYDEYCDYLEGEIDSTRVLSIIDDELIYEDVMGFYAEDQDN